MKKKLGEDPVSGKETGKQGGIWKMATFEVAISKHTTHNTHTTHITQIHT